MADENNVAPEKDVDASNGDQGNLNEEKKSKKGGVLIILLGAFLLAGGGAYYFGFFNKKEGQEAPAEKNNTEELEKTIKKEEEKNTALNGDLMYYTLPELTANLRDKNSFLKISLVLEYYDKANEALIEEKLPLIIDQLQLFLRDLQKEDFMGTAMLTKLKEALLIRINNIMAPLKINSVLLKDLLVQ